MGNVAAAITTLLSRFDQYQRANRWLAFAVAVVKKYTDDQAGHTAALLAYYGFLSLFPLLLVLTSVLKLLHSSAGVGNAVVRSAADYFPIVGQELEKSIHGLGATGLALVAGMIVALYGARGVADVLRSGLDHIWQVPRAERSGFPKSLGQSLCIIVVGGLGLVLAPVVSGYAFAFGQGEVIRLATVLLTLFALFWVLVFVIKVGLSTHRALRDIWAGAALAAIGLEILQSLGGYIMARELRHLNDLYGTFALVLGLLFWIYLQAQVLLYMFELDSVRVFRLWPRGLQQPLTEADRTAYQLYMERARFHDMDA